jgi:hypothetical protein
MSAVAELSKTGQKPSRRKRAAKTVDRALRGGILGGATAALAWLLASAIGGVMFVVLIVATVVALIYTVMRGDKARFGIWGLIVIGWALVMLERWAVHSHGGLWVAGAAWLGIVVGARRGGISKWSLPLLAYPVALGAIVVLTNHSLLGPWGSSWLWVAAVLGPVVGARTLLNPSPRGEPKPDAKPDPLAGL